MSSATAGAANEILTEWETSLKNYKNRRHTKSDDAAKAALQLLPTALQWYKLGQSLDALQQVQIVSGDTLKVRTLERNYHEMVTVLPLDYHERLWIDLNGSLWNVLSSESCLERDKTAALRSITPLLTGSSQAAQIGMRMWPLENLSTLLDFYSTSPSTSTCILSLLRAYLLDSDVDWELFLPALHLFQQDSHVWNALVKHMQLHHPGNPNRWKEVLLIKFDDQPQQQQYLTSLLASLHTEEEELQQQLKTAAARMQRIDRRSDQSKPQQQQQQQQHTKEQEIQRRIAQVKAVLPDLGDGFIETALAAHAGKVDETVATLLEPKPQWPAILQVTDPHLPRRKQEFQVLSSLQQDEEARAIAKATIQAAERQRQHEAQMVDLVLGGDDEDNHQQEEEEEEEYLVKVQRSRHSEYNDDYDDQFDDMNNQVGNADSGLYDNYDAVRMYNAAFKQVEAEQKFWEENRNTNQPSQEKVVTDRKDKGFGPDKLRGGRIPGRGSGRGGRAGGRGESGNATVLTGTKNDNEQSNTSQKTAGNNSADGGKPNLRQKARKLDKRREQQKKAQVKRTGA